MVASLRAACPLEDARAAGAVTHADLFFENPVKLPFLNIELPLLAFFFLAPILFLVVHAYTFVHLVMLTDKAKRFHQALRDRIGDDDSLPKVQRARPVAIRDGLQRQLPSNIFVQFHPRAVSILRRLRRRNHDPRSGLNRAEALHVADRLRPDVARARETDLARRGYGRAPEADGDGVTVGPIGDFAWLDDRVRVVLALHSDRNVEVDLFSPARHAAFDRQTFPDRVRCRRPQEFRFERDGSELELYFAHGSRLIDAELLFREHAIARAERSDGATNVIEDR